MLERCHRCGEELPAASGESPFCPHCGAPQLYLSLDQQSLDTGDDAQGGSTTGALPPPPPRMVDWKIAIRCAALVALVGAVLSLCAIRVQMLSPISFLWIMSGSLITLGLYQKRLPAAWMDVRVGARIGVVVGLCLSSGLAIAMAGWGLVERFGLHAMGSFDEGLGQVIQMMRDRTLQQPASPETAEMLRWLATPEFRAVYALTACAMAAACILLVSALGGAFAGLLRTRRGHA